MIKATISYSGNEKYFAFETSIPKIPEKGDSIGFWHTDSYGDDVWIVAEVVNIIYEFNQNKTFDGIEINVSDQNV